MVTMGDGNTTTMISCNPDGEGLLSMYHSDAPHEPGQVPSDIDLEFPDMVLLFRTPETVDFLIGRLRGLKNKMPTNTEEQPHDEPVQKEPGFFDRVKTTLKKIFK
jgi:hypothetical protein